VVKYLALVLACACSSKKPRVADDARHTRADALATDAPSNAATIDAPPISNAKTGDLQVRVEWKDVPVPMRASPGRTACKTARQPAVAPTTTWGIPEVLVVVEGAAIPPVASHVVLAGCALAPRMIAATTLVLESAVDRPAKVAFAKRGDLASIDKLDKAAPRDIQLPIAGHQVILPLEASGIYELSVDTETAWIVSSGNAGVTEPNGQLLVKDLAPGKYAVTAWLPPRAGATAKIAKGTATIVAGDLEAVTLELK